MRNIKLLVKFCLKHKLLFALCTLTNLLKAGVSVSLAVLLGSIIDIFTSGDFSGLNSYLLICALFIVLVVIIYWLDMLVSTTYTQKTICCIRDQLFNAIIKKDIIDFQRMHSGQYLSILNNDINIIKQDFIDASFCLIFQLLYFIISVILLCTISPFIVVLIIGLSILGFIITAALANNADRKKEQFSHQLEHLSRITMEFFTGFTVIKNFNIIDKIESVFKKNGHKLEKSRKDCNMMIGYVNSLAVVMSIGVFLIVLVVCVKMISSQSLSVGAALVIMQLTNAVSEPITQVLSIFSQMKSVQKISKKINAILTTDARPEGNILTKSIKKNVQFKDVSFSYGPEDLPSLKNINLTFEKGKKYVVIGESGSGKSTLARLLMRYYDNYSGKILIDNVSINEVSSDCFYSLFSMIEPNVFIFNESLKENLCLFNRFKPEKIHEVIDKTRLHNLVNMLPRGLDTVVGEKGSTLSGGECQRVALGRALLKDSQVLILDEFNSNLDNETSVGIEQSMLNLDGITVITITHKIIPSILSQYDEIIVMHKGRVAETGDFASLIAQKGYFYSMYHMQQEDVVFPKSLVSSPHLAPAL